MRFCSGPFPPPFSGHRRRRVGGDDPGGGDCAGAHRSRPQRRGHSTPAPSLLGVSKAPLPGPPCPEFEPPVGSSIQASCLLPLPPPPSRSPRFYLRGRIPRPSCSLAQRSLPIPACTAPPRRRAGPSEGSPAPGCCARLYAPPLRGPAAAPAQFSERPTRVRKLTGPPPSFLQRGEESGGRNQWTQEGESWSRPTLQNLLWLVISLVRAAGVDPSFDP